MYRTNAEVVINKNIKKIFQTEKKRRFMIKETIVSTLFVFFSTLTCF